MPIRKAETNAEFRLALAQKCIEMLKAANCEVDEAYDYDLPAGVSREDAEAALRVAASQVLGRRLKFIYREDAGQPYLQFIVTGIPVKARRMTTNTFQSVFELQEHFESLVRDGQVGKEYEATFENVSVASILGNLDAAARRVLGRRLSIAYAKEGNKVVVRFTVTDQTATSMPRRSNARRKPASLAERTTTWRPRRRTKSQKKEAVAQ